MWKARPTEFQWRWAVSLQLAILSLVIYYLTVLAIDPLTSKQSSVGPGPDGAEYLASGLSFARQGNFQIHVAGESHPSRYPPGYSLLIAMAYRAGAQPVAAPYRVNQAVGILLLATLFLFLRYGTDPSRLDWRL